MNSKSHIVAYPQYGAERVCPRTQVGHCPKIFKRSVFFLKRVPYRVAFAKDLNLLCLYLDCLPASHRLN